MSVGFLPIDFTCKHKGRRVVIRRAQNQCAQSTADLLRNTVQRRPSDSWDSILYSNPYKKNHFKVW